MTRIGWPWKASKAAEMAKHPTYGNFSTRGYLRIEISGPCAKLCRQRCRRVAWPRASTFVYLNICRKVRCKVRSTQTRCLATCTQVALLSTGVKAGAPTSELAPIVLVKHTRQQASRAQAGPGRLILHTSVKPFPSLKLLKSRNGVSAQQDFERCCCTVPKKHSATGVGHTIRGDLPLPTRKQGRSQTGSLYFGQRAVRREETWRSDRTRQPICWPGAFLDTRLFSAVGSPR